MESKIETLKKPWPDNHHIKAQIRKQLQILRNQKYIVFEDNRGHYTLMFGELLESEKADLGHLDVKTETDHEKREYLIETYIRRAAWAKEAKEAFGNRCLYKNCSNTFKKNNGEPYIEVHHIIPLCEKGENKLSNLSVLCCLLYTSPSPRDRQKSRMPSSA